MWDVAINDKLTCNLKIKKEYLTLMIFKDIWNPFLIYVHI